MHRPFSHSRLALAAMLAVVAVPALAQPAAKPSWNLPAGPLGSTLLRIAQHSGQPISVPPELVRGLNAPAIQGSFSVEDAARAALAGQALSLARTANGTLTVVPARPPASQTTRTRPTAPMHCPRCWCRHRAKPRTRAAR